MSTDVVDRFLAHAGRAPDSPALLTQGREVSYGEMEARVRRFAAAVAEFEEPRVLIALPPSLDAYCAILGVALAGGYHTPVNLSAPVSKLRRIAEVLRPNAVIANGDTLAALGEAARGALQIDAPHVGEEQFAGEGVRHRLAYTMFTSGSTGVPKGVVVSRSALNHYVDWLGALEITPEDRLSQQPNLGFDISMTDIFGALCNGATLCPLERDADRMTPALFIARHGITVWNSTPSAISLMMRARQLTATNVASVRLFNFCGEPLLREHLDAIFAVRPDVVVQNTYGPTEATISMTALRITADGYDDLCDSSVAIGDAIPGMAYRLVGGPDADHGEIVIFGPQLAEGYWQDGERTEASFRLTTGGERGYFTGDWAERRNGQVFFKERIDFQVKVRGHRVELDEVASAIRTCGWPVACVFKWGEALGAVVEDVPDRAFDEGELKGKLAEHVEAHAVPERLLSIAQMPRNENDKLDRKAAAAWFEENLA